MQLSVEIGLMVESGRFPTEWKPVGSGAADLAPGTTDLRRTDGPRPHLMQFGGETRHSAHPLWFVFTVKEALRVGAIEAAEIGPDRIRVEVDLRSTAKRGSAHVPTGLIRRLFSKDRANDGCGVSKAS